MVYDNQCEKMPLCLSTIAINLTVDQKSLLYIHYRGCYSPFNYLDCFCPEELYPVCVLGLPRAHHAEGIRLGQQVSVDQVLTAIDTPHFIYRPSYSPPPPILTAGSISLKETRCPSSPIDMYCTVCTGIACHMPLKF